MATGMFEITIFDACVIPFFSLLNLRRYVVRYEDDDKEVERSGQNQHAVRLFPLLHVSILSEGLIFFPFTSKLFRIFMSYI